MEQVPTLLLAINSPLLQFIQHTSYHTNLWVLYGSKKPGSKAKLLYEQCFNIVEWCDQSILLNQTNKLKQKSTYPGK